MRESEAFERSNKGGLEKKVKDQRTNQSINNYQNYF